MWEGAPATTNAVERQILDSKQRYPVNIKEAMTRLYFYLKYITASENVHLSYTNSTLENIKKQSKKDKSKEYHMINLLYMDHQIRLQISMAARGTMRMQNSSYNQQKNKSFREHIVDEISHVPVLVIFTWGDF